MESANRQRNQLVGLITGVGLLMVITAFHYLTESHAVEFHNVYRRLYYLPILLLAFSHGLRGGLISALTACAVYAPHAFFAHHPDPAPAVDKLLEMILYLVVGGLTGWLVNRQQRVQRDLERAVAQREALEQQLVRAGRLSALGQLTSGLAHEIRNPLASILGAAEALATEFGPEHRKHRMAQLLLKEIHRLSRVVSDFLRFARPGESRVEPLDMAEVVTEVLELTQQATTHHAVEIDVDLKPGAMIVEADRGQIGQVVLNLLLNAFQALERSPGQRGRVIVRHQTRTIAGARYLCLAVEDTGPGIPADHLEDVFNPYFTTRAEGTGLGLTISSGIVEAHGGFVDIESTPGRTVVWVCLRPARESP